MENKKAALAALVRKWCEEKDNAVRMESRMKTVIAIDSFKGSMTSMEAGNAAAAGVKAVFPDAEIVVRPLADGGEGTVEALTTGMGGRMETALVSDPLGRKISASYGILEKNKTAVIEMAAAAGLPLLSKEERNPLHTTTYGVGELIWDAIRKGCRHFIVGIGGSATNDGGVGMLSALGFEFLDKSGQPVRNGAAGLADLAEIRSGHVLPVLKECTFRVACDVENSLCGELGCSSVFGPQKGAAGGLGFAFQSYLGARLEPGIRIVLEETGLEREMADADFVLTGEGRMDEQTAMGKAPVGVAKLAKKHGCTVIAFAGALQEGFTVCHEIGIDAAFCIQKRAVSLEEAMDRDAAMQNLTDTCKEAFRLVKAVVGVPQ